MAKNRIMVCVTQQKACERLLKKAVELKETDSDEIYMVHVIKNDWRFKGDISSVKALDFLFELASKHDASIQVFNAGDIVEKLSEFSTLNKINRIVMGESLEKKKHQNMIYRLKKRLVEPVDINIVSLHGIEDTNTEIEETKIRGPYNRVFV